MHAALVEALAPILRDLAVTGAPAPRVADEPWVDAEVQPSAWLELPEGSRVAISVWLPASPVQRIAALADRIQEGICELRWPNSSTWPECPEHPDSHPLSAVVVMNQAWWVCPRSGAQIAVIGRLT